MALTTPILYSVNAFDATQPQVFSFNVVGGNQVIGSTLIIKDNSTLSTVYTGEQTTFKFEHTLPANSLTNGTYYQAILQTHDVQGNISSESNAIQFYCYTQPRFEITNMPINNIVSNSSFSFDVTYNQNEGELLNAYVFNLYNVSDFLIATSGPIYNTSTTLPFIGSYLFSGFDDKSNYQIEVTGETTSGTQITTGKISFNVIYSAPEAYSILFLSNNCDNGYITIQTNITAISGTSNPINPTYINNEEIDLTADGDYVEWNKGYTLTDDWTTRIWGRNFGKDEIICELGNANGDKIELYYSNNSTQCWLELRVVNSGNDWGYNIESNIIDLPTSDEQIFCWIRKIGNLYELKIENRGVVA